MSLALPFPFDGSGLAIAGLVVSSVACLIACFTDLRSRRIPNLLNIALAVSLLSLHFAASGWAGLDAAGSSFAICFGIGLVLYLAGVLGAGDVKFLGALALGIGVDDAWQLLLRTALAGGVLGITRLLLDGNFGNALFGLLSSAKRAKAAGSSVPYALAISGGWFWLWAARAHLVD
jgi:Flp pilus assembly protein protease CpaA